MQCKNNQYMHLYKSLGILLKENNRLKNNTVLFLREKHNSVSQSSFYRGPSKEILNDSPFNFGRYTSCMQDSFARARTRPKRARDDRVSCIQIHVRI